MGSGAAPIPRPGGNDKPGLKVINAALFRMGTKSMAHAYQILGYKTHHGLLEDVTASPWTQLEEAAEATWPSVPEARPRPPFQRADWDALWGDKYDAVTDLASPFAIELIKAYPDAKVVVVQRDFDKWWPSFREEVLDRVMIQPMAAINGWIGWKVMGIRAVQAMRKLHFGFFHAQTREEAYRNARKAYDDYFAEIRRIVPEERRLEYRMGDGWGPLCAFLDVPVPDVPFPQANEQAAHQQEVKRRLGKFYGGFLRKFAPLIVGAAAVTAGWLWYQRA
ncbi:hypothetical protein MMYC01_206628 [Madurella mycetomatis]|uniref:Efflux pump antibiotic resistance protein n=1 Tax=Madurella mycetomatis TaxID=100816 RepID=A0A175VX80_9PEZI|nr:hypothetical protein MMYC01_206628 [Madurella mycetomatis]